MIFHSKYEICQDCNTSLSVLLRKHNCNYYNCNKCLDVFKLSSINSIKIIERISEEEYNDLIENYFSSE